jgi:hypothetical protein
LHPGADQRDQLADEEEPEIAVPERAEGCQPSAPAILRRDVPARLVSFSGFYFRNRIDDSPLPRRLLYARGGRPQRCRRRGLRGSCFSADPSVIQIKFLNSLTLPEPI